MRPRSHPHDSATYLNRKSENQQHMLVEDKPETDKRRELPRKIYGETHRTPRQGTDCRRRRPRREKFLTTIYLPSNFSPFHQKQKKKRNQAPHHQRSKALNGITETNKKNAEGKLPPTLKGRIMRKKRIMEQEQT